MQNSEDRRYTGAALLMVALGAILRFWGLDLGLPHILARPDEEVLLIQSAPLAEGRGDLGYAVYPHLFFYACWAWARAGLILARLGGWLGSSDYGQALRDSPEHVLLAARALSATASTATIPLVISATRRALGRGPALAAGLLLATNFLSVREAHAAKPDAAMIFFVVLTLCLTPWLARRPTVPRGLTVGIPVGLGMGMKYPALLALPSAAIAAWMGGLDQRGLRRWIPPPALATAVGAAVAFVATSPFLVLNAETFVRVFSVFGSIFPQWFPEVFTVPPELEQLGQRAWWAGFPYHVLFSLRYGAGLVSTILMPFALAWGLWTRQPLPVACAVYCVVSYVVSGISPMVLSRYMTPLVPALVILQAGLLAALVRPAGRRAPWLLGCAALALVAEPLYASVAHDRLAARTDTRVLAAAWLEPRIDGNGPVAFLGTRVWGYGEPTLDARIVRVREDVALEDLATAGVRYVYTHDHPLLFSSTAPDLHARLAARGDLVSEFDPFRAAPAPTPVFEEFDAYYIPMHGFDAMDRPGPHVRIYDLDSRADRRPKQNSPGAGGTGGERQAPSSPPPATGSGVR